jgi:site-specific recombinase XerD
MGRNWLAKANLSDLRKLHKDISCFRWSSTLLFLFSRLNIIRYVRTLKAFFPWATREEYITPAQFGRIPVPKAQFKIINTFSPEQVGPAPPPPITTISALSFSGLVLTPESITAYLPLLISA